MIPFNIKIALRNLWKNKVFSAINIVGLAISMACCLVISLYVWNELQVDRFHRNADNIYRVTEKQNQGGTLYNVAVTPGRLAPALQKDFPEIEQTVRFGQWHGLLKNNNHLYEQKNIQLTDNSIFKVFDFPLVKGNPATALQSPNDIVITESVAEKYFGKDWRNDPSLLNQSFTMGNDVFKLAGVAKDVPENSSIQFDILLPLAYLFNSDEWSNKWNSNNYHTYLQLKPNTIPAVFEKHIEAQLHTYNPEANDQLALQPLKQQYLYSTFDFKTDWGKRSNIKYIKIFAGVGLLLLLIACVNFINLSTARSLKRSLEVGIRKVSGASRKQLIWQFLSESVLISFIAGVLAILIIGAVHPLLRSAFEIAINTSLSNSMIVPFFGLFTLVIGLLAGMYPAFVLSSFRPIKVLKKAGAIHSGKLFRQGLVVVQFAICVVLISCTFFMHRQLNFMQQRDLGFNKEQIIRIGLGQNIAGKTGVFMHDLDAINGIAGAAPATMSLADVDNSSYVEWQGMSKDDKFLITQANVDPGFIPMLGMKLVSGHNFSAQVTNDTACFIVNESAAKRMGYTIDNAIGKQVTFWGAKGDIIGVVKDFNFKPLNTAIEPFIFRYQPQDRYFNLFIRTQPGQTQQVLTQLEEVYKKYEAESPFAFSFLSDSIDQLYKEDKRTAAIILLFANLTIFVGCLGLFGLSVFSAEQRTKELGIRKVLGAGLASVAGLLSKDFLKLVLIALLIGIPAAWYVTGQWLQNYVYRITIDWWVFALISLFVLAIALFTVSFQAVKAAMVNPVKSLRSE